MQNRLKTILHLERFLSLVLSETMMVSSGVFPFFPIGNFPENVFLAVGGPDFFLTSMIT